MNQPETQYARIGDDRTAYQVLGEGPPDLVLTIGSVGHVDLKWDDPVFEDFHIAARTAAEATARQVVVTRTVRDLATGADLAFTPRGSVSLRGVPGEWDLYEVARG